MTAHPITDGTNISSAPETLKVSSSLVDEIYTERLKTLPNLPARPGDPHYVAQTNWDTAEGLLDLNSGKFTQGKAEINSAISDLGKESTLITGAQASGKTAAQDILNGDTSGAEASLTQTIAGLKGNHYNDADSKEFQSALTDLQSGKTWAAEKDIAKAEEELGHRETKVTTATKEMQTGLNDFNSGHQNEGEADMKKAVDDLHLKPKVNPGGPIDPAPGISHLHVPPLEY